MPWLEDFLLCVICDISSIIYLIRELITLIEFCSFLNIDLHNLPGFLGLG